MKLYRFEHGPIQILAVPVLNDNFDYLICRAGRALLIDAGAAAPVRRALEENGLELEQILLTHEHHDHIGGLPELESLCSGGATGVVGQVREIPTPGHTIDDTAYYFPEAAAVFTGDCLINGACGRLLGGTAEELYDSLQRIKVLPDETRVFGGHDYLEDNLRFGLSVEPDNAQIKARLELYRTDPAAAIFSTLGEEKQSNVFLRAKTAGEFAALRSAKDRF